MKKYIALIVALFVTLGILAVVMKDNEPPTTTAPTEETTTEAITEIFTERSITLGYYEDKSLNPYLTDSPVNRNLSTLIYDGLYVPGEDYMPQPIIAESIEKSEEKLVVFIRPDLYFSSGAPLTASDVAYSFELAKNSPYYSGRLEVFSFATAGTDSVIFTMNSYNAYAESCLTFPIVQAGSGENDIPVGSGRYVLKSDDDGKFLSVNESSTRTEIMSTEKIRLAPITSDRGELYMLQTGDLSYFFDDLSDGEYTRIGANMLRVPLNNLVYLTFNSKSEVLADRAVKQAISLAIDKTAIAENAYSGMCRTAETPFNPDWYVLSPLQKGIHSFSGLKAAEMLEEAGYVYAYKSNDYRSRNFEFLEIDMIVNEENESKVHCAELIHDSLESIGIDVRLKILPFEDYREALYDGEYDIYLGEVKLPASMDLSCFFTEGGSVGYGIDSSSTAATAYSDFSQGKIDIFTFTKVFDDGMPFIPICYRDGVAYYSREISFEGSVTEYEPFLNAYSWEVTNSIEN